MRQVVLSLRHWLHTLHHVIRSRSVERFMRKAVVSLCFLLLIPGLATPEETNSRFAPGVRAFIREDAPVIALVGVRVIDGTGAAPRTNQTLVISGGKIAAFGPTETTKPPADAKVLDLAGRTVIPGLVGMHEHMYYPSPGRGVPLYPQHASSFPRLYL